MVKLTAATCFLLALLLATPAKSLLIISWEHPGAERFDVYRRPQTNPTWQKLATTDNKTRILEDATASPGTTYCYHVKAGDSKPSNELCRKAYGINVHLKPGQKLAVSRRPTDGSSTVGILLDKGEKLLENEPALPNVPRDSVIVNLRPGLKLAPSYRVTTGSSTIAILVDKSEVVLENNQEVKP